MQRLKEMMKKGKAEKKDEKYPEFFNGTDQLALLRSIAFLSQIASDAKLANLYVSGFAEKVDKDKMQKHFTNLRAIYDEIAAKLPPETQNELTQIITDRFNKANIKDLNKELNKADDIEEKGNILTKEITFTLDKDLSEKINNELPERNIQRMSIPVEREIESLRQDINLALEDKSLYRPRDLVSKQVWEPVLQELHQQNVKLGTFLTVGSLKGYPKTPEEFENFWNKPVTQTISVNQTEKSNKGSDDHISEVVVGTKTSEITYDLAKTYGNQTVGNEISKKDFIFNAFKTQYDKMEMKDRLEKIKKVQTPLENLEKKLSKAINEKDFTTIRQISKEVAQLKTDVDNSMKAPEVPTKKMGRGSYG